MTLNLPIKQRSHNEEKGESALNPQKWISVCGERQSQTQSHKRTPKRHKINGYLDAMLGQVHDLCHTLLFDFWDKFRKANQTKQTQQAKRAVKRRRKEEKKQTC